MQAFHTRNYSIRDFADWEDRNELILAPKFQRRDVWSPKARSFLIDTIIRCKPIPKIYMRLAISHGSKRAIREIVDGQQRLNSVLMFLKDGFKISKAHNEEYGGLFFSTLPQKVQNEILKYEFAVDLLEDMPDKEIYDIFARINTYNEKLKPQELRNAKWYGDFKSSAYALAQDLLPFIQKNEIFSAKQILRMNEVEFISEILLAVHEGGVRAGSKAVIDKAYSDYDDIFKNRKRHENRIREVFDIIGNTLGDELAGLKFSSTRLFYPLFFAVYHMKFGLAELDIQRCVLKKDDLCKIKDVVEQTSKLIDDIDNANRDDINLKLNQDEKRFYDAYDEHWVHASNRSILTRYLCKKFNDALK